MRHPALTSSGGLVIAAPASGSGKTVLTLGLLRSLRRQGRRAAAAKSGPDYIDAGFHEAASGRPCLNLDAWAMRPETVAGRIGELEADADVVLCEGAMGLFDGAGERGDRGSTADLAALAGWPVLLVVDARGQAASAAALVRGFATHRPGLALAGIVFNRVGGERHAAMLRAALRDALPDIPVLGALPRDAALALPERHLGLVPAAEHPDIEPFLDAAADAVERAVDMPALLSLARPARLVQTAAGPPLPPLGQRIAVARDAAFAFAYPSVLDGWRRQGAAVHFFSPLADEAPPADADAVYLPGGYPELHGGRLAANARFRAGLGRAAAGGAVLYGECGGYMALGEALIDADGARHAMAGLLPLVTSFAARRLHLGYRAVRAAAATPLGDAGTGYRGHEFHFATILAEGPGEPLFRAEDADGRALGDAGLVRGTVMGSFVHLVDRAAEPSRAPPAAPTR